MVYTETGILITKVGEKKMKQITHRTVRKTITYQSFTRNFVQWEMSRSESNDKEVKAEVNSFIEKHPGAQLKIKESGTYGHSWKTYTINYTEQKFIPFRIQARRFLREVTKDLSNKIGADALEKLSTRSDEVTNRIREVLQELSQ